MYFYETGVQGLDGTNADFDYNYFSLHNRTIIGHDVLRKCSENRLQHEKKDLSDLLYLTSSNYC